MDLPENSWLQCHEPQSGYFGLCPGFVFLPFTVENYEKVKIHFCWEFMNEVGFANPDAESASRAKP